MKFSLKIERHGKVVHFNETLISILNEYDLKDQFLMERLRDKWSKITGDIIATHSIPERIFKKILFIAVDHSVYANELSLMKNMIIEKIKDEFGFNVIRDIRIKVKILDWSKNDTQNIRGA